MASRIAALAESVKTALGDQALGIVEALGEVTLIVTAANLLDVMGALRDRPELRFEQLIDLCGVDYGAYGEVAWSGTPVSEGGAGAPLAGAAPNTDATPPSVQPR